MPKFIYLEFYSSQKYYFWGRDKPNDYPIIDTQQLISRAFPHFQNKENITLQECEAR